MNKKYKYLSFFILLLILVIVLYRTFFSSSPDKAFDKFMKKNPSFVLKKKINLVTLNEKEKILFWQNNNDGLAAIVIEKNCISSWQVIGQVGFVDMNKDNNYMWGKIMYSTTTDNMGLYLGFINNKKNENIHEILINNNKPSLIKLVDNKYIWYFISPYNGSDFKIKNNSL